MKFEGLEVDVNLRTVIHEILKFGMGFQIRDVAVNWI